jgi:hypothetical protein
MIVFYDVVCCLFACATLERRCLFVPVPRNRRSNCVRSDTNHKPLSISLNSSVFSSCSADKPKISLLRGSSNRAVCCCSRASCLHLLFVSLMFGFCGACLLLWRLSFVDQKCCVMLYQISITSNVVNHCCCCVVVNTDNNFQLTTVFL